MSSILNLKILNLLIQRLQTMKLEDELEILHLTRRIECIKLENRIMPMRDRYKSRATDIKKYEDVKQLNTFVSKLLELRNIKTN